MNLLKKVSKIKALRSLKILFFPAVILTLFFAYTKKQIKKNRIETRKVRFDLGRRLSSGTMSISPYMDSMELPFSLCNTPLGEDDGVVLDVKTISIRNVVAPYNATIIDHEEGFLLFFRYDELHYDCGLPFKTHIGCIKLDENLEQTEEEYRRIQLENEFNEDPRVFRCNGDLYLSYNSIRKNRPKDSLARIMKLARLDNDTMEVKEEVELDIRKQKIEKNWTPFCVSDNTTESMCFKYYIVPNQNLILEDFSRGSLHQVATSNQIDLINSGWAPAWGEPRGGTPALKIGDEYLAFFHSSFRCLNGSFWYIMGAYTFEGQSPFRMTAISHYPLFFKGVFSSPILNTANPTIRCTFPGGFVIKEKEGKEVVYLAIGENDSCVKVLTLDKEMLLKTLKKFSF